MKQVSGQTVKLLNEERALLMSLAAKRDVTYSDILRIGLYQLAAIEGLDGPLAEAVQARVEHLFCVEAAWCGIRIEQAAESSHTGGV
ncbi:MAG: hypothetical protein H8K03_09270 [Nitrospira sp.]